MAQKKYRPIADDDRQFTLKPRTGGSYKKLKMITLHSSTTTLSQKMAIIKEFNLDYDPNINQFFAEINSPETPAEKKLELINNFKVAEANQALLTSDYGLEGYMKKVVEVVFLEKMDDVTFEDFDLDEIGRALNDFFYSSGSNSGGSSDQ